MNRMTTTAIRLSRPLMPEPPSGPGTSGIRNENASATMNSR